MPAFRNILAVVFLLTAISFIGATRAETETPDAASAETPSGIVARWLTLHRMGDRQKASALTSGSRDHRADVLLPSKRDTGVRVARSLGNERAAAVVTTKLENDVDDERVLLFWLVRRDGVWRINKSYRESNRVVDERLRGFLEAGNVRWYVQRGHGAQSEYYYDHDAESHVLEVWPVGIEEPEEHEGNGREQKSPALLYELAEFDFAELGKEVPLEHFHFSQRRSIFEIGWEEDGQHFELRVHIVPVEVAEDY